MIQKATLSQGKDIFNLIRSNSAKTETGLLPRPLKYIYENIRDFIVYVENGVVIGCACLHIFWNDLAEIICLAVQEGRQGQGIGTQLVHALEFEGIELRIPELFTLTKATNFFEKIGYVQIHHDKLPKVWVECINCPKFTECDETALIKKLDLQS